MTNIYKIVTIALILLTLFNVRLIQDSTQNTPQISAISEVNTSK